MLALPDFCPWCTPWLNCTCTVHRWWMINPLLKQWWRLCVIALRRWKPESLKSVKLRGVLSQLAADEDRAAAKDSLSPITNRRALSPYFIPESNTAAINVQLVSPDYGAAFLSPPQGFALPTLSVPETNADAANVSSSRASEWSEKGTVYLIHWSNAISVSESMPWLLLRMSQSLMLKSSIVNIMHYLWIIIRNCARKWFCPTCGRLIYGITSIYGIRKREISKFCPINNLKLIMTKLVIQYSFILLQSLMHIMILIKISDF